MNKREQKNMCFMKAEGKGDRVKEGQQDESRNWGHMLTEG